MIDFYLSAIGLVIIALLFVLYPVIRAKKHQAQELSNANVVKQRISELDREVDEGLIDSEEKQQSIQDLKVALVDETPETTTSASKIHWGIFTLLALPGLLIGLWVYSESNQIKGLQEYQQAKIDVVRLREQLQENGGQGLVPNDFATLALSIRSALRDNPEDAAGWSYLGLLSTNIGRLEEAVAAYQKSLKIEPNNDQVRFKYAETLMVSGTEEHLQIANRQLTYLIGKSGDNRNYRLLLTTVAIKLQDAALATTHFNLIKNQLDPNSQFYQSIVAELAKLGVNTLASATQTESLDDQNTLSNKILITVDVDDALGSLPNNAYLIVFAQHNDGRSRAPLAVNRALLNELPVQVSLSDDDAMIPAMNLSSAETVKITARISLDEDVMPSAGEFEGTLDNINLNTTTTRSFTVVIDKELK